MKKKLSVLIAGVLFMAVNLYAEPGDVFVEGKLGVGTTTPSAKVDVNGKIRGNAVYSYDGSDITGSTSSTSDVWASDISTTINVQTDDLVIVQLSCNLMAAGSVVVYIRPGLYAGSASAILYPNWITVSTPYYWSGGSSTSLFKATSDGNLTFQGQWHTSGGTGYYVYCNIIAWVIGKV